MFITAAACISPQDSFRSSSVDLNPVEYNGNRLSCKEPDYREWIDPKMIRRMSRIIKMGVTTALSCCRNAGITVPDAIITGTAYGCLEDTGVFLNRMIEFNEEMLNPTSFIQSTHNTVGAQIALLMKCYGYNNTFVHRGFSFESALLDAILLLKDKEVSNVLVGAADELTDISFTILQRFGSYRTDPVSNLQLLETSARGSVAGEGAAFFLLSAEAGDNDLAALDAIHSFYRPADEDALLVSIESFLQAQSMNVSDIDLVITGVNGDAVNDAVYKNLFNGFFSGVRHQPYKQLCGEYPSSAAFALWYAATILSGDNANGKAGPKRILIYNHYQQIHHTLFLLSSC